MSNFSNDLFQMRFSKSVNLDSSDLNSLNMEMRRLFLAIDETKNLSLVASQLRMEFAFVRNCIIKLLKKRLIKPVGQFKLCVDRNYSKLLKVNLHYLVGRKEIAYASVDKVLKKNNLSYDKVPVDMVSDVVEAASSIISNIEVRREFCAYMKSITPLRMKIKKVPKRDKRHGVSNTPDATRGKTKQIIDIIIAVRSGGNPRIAKDIKTKLMLKGINPNQYTTDTLDDPNTIAILRKMANAMGVDLSITRGKTKQIIERIVAARSGGDPTIEKNIKIKLVLKGINPYKYTDETLDDPKIIERLHKMATMMGVNLTATRGSAKKIIDRIVAVRSGGDPAIAKNIKTKLMFKGVNPYKYANDTLDDPKTIVRLRKMAYAMGVDLHPISTHKTIESYA